MDMITVRVESEPGQLTQSDEQLINLLSHKIKTFISISAEVLNSEALPRVSL
jgi:hypothetical protein